MFGSFDLFQVEKYPIHLQHNHACRAMADASGSLTDCPQLVVLYHGTGHEVCEIFPNHQHHSIMRDPILECEDLQLS